MEVFDSPLVKTMKLFRTGRGVGDVLLATGVIRGWQRKYNHRLLVETLLPELFVQNTDVALVWRDQQRASITTALFDHQGLWRIGSMFNTWWSQHSTPINYPFPCRGRHLIDAMAESLGTTLLEHERRPFIHLTKMELAAQNWAHDHIVVQSSSTTYWTANKHWLPGRMQAVVDTLHRAGYKLIQLGVSDDAALDHVRDLRGRTTLRESAAILANARLLIGLEGGLVHMARAVDTRAAVIYTGYTRPEETGYPENMNLRDPAAGEGCWLREPCDHCRASAEAISADIVVEAALNYLSAAHHTLGTSAILLNAS